VCGLVKKMIYEKYNFLDFRLKIFDPNGGRTMNRRRFDSNRFSGTSRKKCVKSDMVYRFCQKKLYLHFIFNQKFNKAMKKVMLFFAAAVIAFGVNAQGDKKDSKPADSKATTKSTDKKATDKKATDKKDAKPAAKSTDKKDAKPATK
jgi:hypothetical protein